MDGDKIYIESMSDDEEEYSENSEHIDDFEKTKSFNRKLIYEKINWDIEKTLNNTKKKIKNINNDIPMCKIDFKNIYYVFTEESKRKLKIIIDYLKIGTPILLEGETGTAKTLSAIMACILTGRKMTNDKFNEVIRFNFSLDTKVQDLIGRYVNDNDTWAIISQHDGPFLQAIKNGYVLILDEINLASPAVLQVIEESLDSGFLSIEIPGRPLEKIKIHPNFRLIATQNPNKGLYKKSTQNPGVKFYSKFQIINFPPFTKNELYLIAKGLSEKFGYKNAEVVKQIIDFHQEWSDNNKNDIKCFTIREIAATINAISKNKSIYQTIMIIYGARYQKEKREQLSEMLKKYPLLNEIEEQNIPHLKGIYMNESFSRAINASFFSLENGRHILIISKKGYGRTKLATLVSNIYNKNICKKKIIESENEEEENDDEINYWICNEETKMADLIGRQAPVENSKKIGEYITWKDGILIDAIRKGETIILDNFDQAPSSITERLNPLLDLKFNKINNTFYVQENTKNPYVEIKDTFRIIATCDIDNLYQMSPALINRYDLIFLDQQIENDISPINYKELITTLMNNHLKNSPIIELEPNKQHLDHDEEEEDEFEDDYDDDDDDGVIHPEYQVTPELLNSSTIAISDPIIEKTYEVLKDENNMYQVSRICKTIVNLCQFFQKNQHNKVTYDKIIEFSFVFHTKSDYVIPQDIELSIIELFDDVKFEYDDRYFYKSTPKLRSLMVKLFICSIVQQAACIEGETGIGKTSSAVVFSLSKPFNKGYQLLNFSEGTKISDTFGNITVIDNQIQHIDKPLTISMKQGNVFIADEFNISKIMDSCAIALERDINKKVIIPGTGEKIKIHPGFQFIICQNEITTIGRKEIPPSIASKIIKIKYPNSDLDLIESICLNIADNIISTHGKFTDDHKSFAKNLANYMFLLNKSDKICFKKWSIRDIKKLYKRIYQNDNKNIIGVSKIHHIVFYTMSSVLPQNEEVALDEIRNNLELSFKLDQSEIDNYINCYKANPIIDAKDQEYFIIKNECKIEIDSKKTYNKLIFNQNLPSLWNAYFMVSIAHPSEHILLIGNSGFKTFLAKLILNLADIISINPDANIDQIIGSSEIMTFEEAKLFYLDYLCYIIQDNSKIVLRDKWMDGTLTKEEIDALIKKAKDNVSPAFHYALDNLSEKLIREKDNPNLIFSDTILEFHPGLFLNSILKNKSLIIKDLSNLQTVVLERLNEFFAPKPKITLIEDNHNTFTKENSRELTGFDESIRFIGTAPINSIFKLSDAILSRFTSIFIREYQFDEEKCACKSYINFYKLNFNIEKQNGKEDDIDKLASFSEAFMNAFGTSFSFPQKLKVVEIASKMNTNNSIENQKINIGIALYRVLKGNIDSEEKQQLLYTLIDNNFSLPNFYEKHDSDECPLVINPVEEKLCLQSNITNLFSESVTVSEPPKNIIHTGYFNDLLDVIHMSLTINSPLIIEMKPGYGTHTAYKYIANMLNMKIVHIIISLTTKIQDLFGKIKINTNKKNNQSVIENIQTEFLKSITSKNSDKNILIVIEGLDNASPALLDFLVPVFDTHSDKIMLHNGDPEKKGKFNIIGLFNNQYFSSIKDKLPPSLINSSICYSLLTPKQNEIKKMISQKFEMAELSEEETNHFISIFEKATKIIKNEVNSLEFTLYDIEKYIQFRSIQNGIFSKSVVLSLIFAYRFSSKELINKMIRELSLEKDLFPNPVFSYNNPPTHLIIKIRDDEIERLQIPLYSTPKDTSILSKTNSLNSQQKSCLIILAASLLTKNVSLVQGDTASGKSFLVQLLKELLGADLVTYQMNSQSYLRMLSMQSVISKELSDEDKHQLSEDLNNLSTNDSIKNFILNSSGIIPKNFKTYSLQKFNDLLMYIQEIYPNITESNNDIDITIKNSYYSISNIMNPINRLKNIPSSFIQSLKKGGFVLFDGFEFGDPAISQKISTLHGENRYINLFEYGEDFHLSSNANSPEQTINDKFHLFITYNPNSQRNNQEIIDTLLNKCISYFLPQYDEQIEYSVQFLFGSFLNLSYPYQLAEQLSVRFAQLHDMASKESKKNPDNFAGGIPFNPRTLKHLIDSFPPINKENIHSIINDSEGLLAQIQDSIMAFYSNSYINDNIMQNNEFYTKCIEKFSELPQARLVLGIHSNDMLFSGKNDAISIIFKDIHNCLSQKTKTNDFSFLQFIEKYSSIQIIDLPNIHYDLDIIFIKINEFDEEQKQEYLDKFGCMAALYSIFDPNIKIKQNQAKLSFRNSELMDDTFMIPYKLKFDLLYSLLKERLFSEHSSYLVKNARLENIISCISACTVLGNKSSFESLLSNIHTEEDINDIDKYFPYLLFSQKDDKSENVDHSMIPYWIYLIKIMLSNGVKFSVSSDYGDFEFNLSSSFKFSVNLIFKEKDSVLLSENSKLSYFDKKLKKRKFDFNKKDIHDITNKNLKYYDVIKTLAEKPNNFVDKERIMEIKLKAQSDCNHNLIKFNDNGTILSIKDLYKNDEIPLISKIWNLVYTLPKGLISNLIHIIHPIESALLKTAYQIFDQIADVQKVILWTNWAAEFERNTKLLKKYYFRQKDDYLCYNENEIEEIQYEINYLSRSPFFNKILNPYDWITILKTILIKLEEMKNQLNDSDSNKKNFQKILFDLNNLNIRPEYGQMKSDLISYISKLDKTSDDQLDFAKKLVDQFDKISNVLYTAKKTNNSIEWPKINIESHLSNDEINYNSDLNIRLFNKLIWYSQILEIINKIKEKENIIENFWKLIDFPEMEYPRSIIFPNLSLDGLDNKSLNKLMFTLKAHMIYKLFEIDKNLIMKHGTIYETINKYRLRNPIKKYELKWIADSQKEISPDFMIYIPKFEPIDLFYLVVIERSSNDFKAGPLFTKYEKNKSFLKSVSDLMNSNYSTFQQVAESIAQIYYKFNIDHHDDNKTDFDKMRKCFIDKRLYEILNLLEIAEGLDKWKTEQESELIYDDILLLSGDWMNCNELIQRYPSLFYWMLQNIKFSDQFVKKSVQLSLPLYHNQIPFWVLNLRIRSSYNCIKFEIKSSGYTSMIISEAINSVVFDYLEKANESKSKITYDWFEILLNSMPLDLSNDVLKMIHRFFINLTFDNKRIVYKLINEKKFDIIHQTISELMKQILSGKYLDLMTKNILEEDTVFKFLFFPTKYILKNIKDHKKSFPLLIANNKTISKLQNYLKKNNKLPRIIKDLNNAIAEDEMIVENNKEEKMKIDLNKWINEYNLNIYNLINHEIERDKIGDAVSKLIDLNNKLSRFPELFKTEGITVYPLEYYSNYSYYYYYYSRKTIKMKINTTENNKTVEKTINLPNIGYPFLWYLYPDETFIKGSPYYRGRDRFFNYIHEKYNIDDIVSKYISKEKPYLIFGRNTNCTKSIFMEKMEQLNYCMKEANDSFFNIRIKETKTDTFKIFDSIYDLIVFLNDHLNVSFSDSTSSENTYNILQNQFRKFLTDLKPLIVNIINFKNNEIYPFLNELREWKTENSIFNNHYDIPIPEIPIKHYLEKCKPKFNMMKNIDSISSPIISILDDKNIICSVKKLEIITSPIFPSILEDVEPINIVSLINYTIKCQFENLEISEFENIVLSKEEYEPNEPIQINIKVHPPKQNLTEPKIIKGNLRIEKSYVIKPEKDESLPFILPFEFKLVILPITAILHCKQYKLAEERTNYFRLCCTKICSGSKLNFSINNYFKNYSGNCEFKLNLESLIDNESEIPTLNKYNQKFLMKMENVYEPKRCHFLITIAFSQNFKIYVHCDFIITPITIGFEIYDYKYKCFKSQKYKMIYQPEVPQKMIVRIASLYSFQGIGTIKHNFPKNFINNDQSKMFNTGIEFNENSEISFDVTVPDDFEMNRKYYHIILKIANIKKKIQIIFEKVTDAINDPDDNFFKNIPCIFYNNESKDWDLIKNMKEFNGINKMDIPKIFINPFYLQTNIKEFLNIYYREDRIQHSISNKETIIYIKCTLANLPGEDISFIKTQSDLNIENNKYYTIVGFEKENPDYWFPAFDQYPIISSMPYLPYEFNEENIENAENNINNLLENVEKDSNLMKFLTFLRQKSNIIQIYLFIQNLPQSIIEKFESFYQDIKDIIKSEELTEEKCSIISYNLILWFLHIFSEKYKELKSHKFFLRFPLSKNEIKTQFNKLTKEFFDFDPSMDHKFDINTLKLFNQEEEKMKKFKVEKLPDDSNQHELFIINEHSSPRPWEINDKFIEYHYPEKVDDKSNISENECQIARLPQIEIPQTFTISSLKSFYSICCSGASILPVYVKSCTIHNKSLDESEMYCSKLSAIYKKATNEFDYSVDNSIVSTEVNSFINAYNNCFQKLHKAGADFTNSELPPIFFDQQKEQNLILRSKIENIYLGDVIWKIKKQFSHNFMNCIDPFYSGYKYDIINDSNYNYHNMPMFSLIDKEKEHQNSLYSQIDNQKSNININSNITTITVYDGDENEKDHIIENENDDNSHREDLLTINRKNIFGTQSTIITSEVLNNLALTELNVIDSIIKRINHPKKDDAFMDRIKNVPECFIENPEEKFNIKISIDDLPIKNLIYKSKNISAHLLIDCADFLSKDTNSNIPFNSMSCNLLIDCSNFISITNRLFNFMLLTAFSYALSALEIPFSIIIFADRKFRFVLKDFNEKISMLILQRVLDCLFIKRLQSSLVDTVNHAINHFALKESNRTQRAIFVFSNGIDDDLVYANKWKEVLLNNPDLSFGFLFAKSELLDENKFSVFKNLWNDFNTTVKDAESKTKLMYYSFNSNIDNKDDQTYHSIYQLFVEILSRPLNNDPKYIDNKIFYNPILHDYKQLNDFDIRNIEEILNVDFSKAPSMIYHKENQNFKGVNTLFNPVDLSKIHSKIINDKNQNISLLFHKMMKSKLQNTKPILETCFKPNKSAIQSYSDNGGEIDIMELLIAIILQQQNPQIYLEYKDFSIRNYSITFIIDSSKSCFNDISSSHSYQTIKNLFVGFSSIFIPCVDIIIAQKDEPIVLARDIPSNALFNENSSFWNSLFSCLAKITFKKDEDSLYCDMESAIQVAYALRSKRSADYKSYLFILTDGLYQTEQKELVHNHIIKCFQQGFPVYGIGIGIYPKGIFDIFHKSIFVPNPNNIIKGLTYFFGNDNNKTNIDSMGVLAPEKASFYEINECFMQIIKDEKNPVFYNLKEYLKSIVSELDCFRYIHDEEMEGKHGTTEICDIGGDSEIYIEGALKGQKILFVMPYDCSVNLEENKKIHPRYLVEPSDTTNGLCVKKAADHLGAEFVIVRNYKEAYYELIKKTPDGKCPYYLVCVMSSLPFDIELPNRGNQHLVIPFLQILIEFWEKGGSVIHFSDGYPFTFQTNLFLEMIRFPGKYQKTKLRLGEVSHLEKNMFHADKTGKLDKPCTFNKQPLYAGETPRTHFTNNISFYYSGETISCSTSNDRKDFLPFIPFMKDSENGFCGFFYQGDADLNNIRGDIIIDCGFTKLFDKMSIIDTFRLILNYFGWTAQIESKEFRNIPAKDFHPNAITGQFNEKVIYHNFLTHMSVNVDLNSLKRVFAIDISLSIRDNDDYFYELENNIIPMISPEDKIILWNDNAVVVEKDILNKYLSEHKKDYQKRELDGKNSTRPAPLAQLFIDDPTIEHEHLIILTDGEILPQHIQECDQIIKENNLQFKYVTTYVVRDNGDLSARAPFTRNCGSVTIDINNNLRTTYYTNVADLKLLDIIDQINTIEEFEKYSNGLIEATWNKLMGTKGDQHLKDQYEELEKRLEEFEEYGDKCEIVENISLLIQLASGKCERAFRRADLTAMKKSH